MRYSILSLFCLMIALSSCGTNQSTDTSQHSSNLNSINKPDYAVIIHGGAGAISKERMADDSLTYKLALRKTIQYADSLLNAGDEILDVLESTIQSLENNPLFNAGKGAVLTNAGKVELDASIMQGSDRNAGAVAGVKHIKNPISAARMIMEQSEHVMLVGEGAEKYVFSNPEIDQVENAYFITERRRAQWENSKMGTVGCVIYKAGEIVAATSTGGMMNKRFGRVGDAPIIGAGTYADNNTCGLSATGHGEYFIRGNITSDISARMEYGNMTLEEAMRSSFNEKLDPLNGTGGVIGIDLNGQIVNFRNTDGMFRAWISSESEQFTVKIWE